MYKLAVVLLVYPFIHPSLTPKLYHNISEIQFFNSVKIISVNLLLIGTKTMKGIESLNSNVDDKDTGQVPK